MTLEVKPSVDVQYEQLNERSRMYTTQLWQIPGLYLALSAWTVEHFNLLESMPNGGASLVMAFVTLVVWVFVSQLKFLERRAVDQMRLLEGKPASTGVTRFFFSYIWYVRTLLVLASFWYLCTAIRYISVVAPWRSEFAIWGRCCCPFCSPRCLCMTASDPVRLSKALLRNTRSQVAS